MITVPEGMSLEAFALMEAEGDVEGLGSLRKLRKKMPHVKLKKALTKIHKKISPVSLIKGKKKKKKSGGGEPAEAAEPAYPAEPGYPTDDGSYAPAPGGGSAPSGGGYTSPGGGGGGGGGAPGYDDGEGAPGYDDGEGAPEGDEQAVDAEDVDPSEGGEGEEQAPADGSAPASEGEATKVALATDGDNTMLYVLGGAAALVAAYFLFLRKK